MDALLLKIGYLPLGVVNLLLVKPRPICPSQIFSFTGFLPALYAVLKRFTEAFLAHEQ
jgi:hypothetical protein